MKRVGRGLIGYMTRDEAIATLQGGSIIAGATPSSELIDKWQKAKVSVESRTAVKMTSALAETPPELRSRIESVQRRPDLIAAFSPHKWRVAMVDLSKPILSYQRVVVVDDAVERVGSAKPDDPASLFEICLPEGQPIQMEGGFDPVQNAFTTSSLNPNLRVASFAAVDSPGPAGSANKVFGFTLSLGTNLIQLVEYRNRWMVRDGYHRIYGLLRRGIRLIPCIVIHAQSFDETGASRPGFFNYELLYGENPPLMSDFLNDELSAEIPVPAFRKVIRIRAEEFAIPI